MSRSRPGSQSSQSTLRSRWVLRAMAIGLLTLATPGFSQELVTKTGDAADSDKGPRATSTPAPQPAGEPIAETTAGQFFSIEEPIRDDTLEQIQASTRPYLDRMAQQGERPILIFEIRPGSSKPGQSRYGTC